MRFRTKLGSLSLGLSLSFPAASTLAEPPDATEADIHNVVSYEFGDEQVQGDLVAPIGEILTVRAKRLKQSLIRARGSFIDKLVRSVESF